MLLRFKPFTTAHHWSFKDPDTKYHYKANNKEELIKAIRGYRQQNELEPLEELDAIVEDYLCKKPENMGQCINGRLKRGFMTYVKGGMRLVKNVVYPSTVTPEEANRRADICAKCPHNVFPDKDMFVKWSDDIWSAAVGSRSKRVTKHDELGNCAICTCPLRAKVWFNGDIELSQAQIQEMKKVQCWQPPLVQISKKG